MNQKEAGFGFFSSKKEDVNPNFVFGDEKRVMTFVVLENGGFEIEGLNLPKNWNVEINDLTEEDLKKFQDFVPKLCNRWGFSLEKMVFDSKEILKEIEIKNSQDESISIIKLADSGEDYKKGKYLSENLNSIESVIVLQEIMAYYFDNRWVKDDLWVDNFSYGYIESNFFPDELVIPDNFLCFSEKFLDKSYQNDFIEKNNKSAKCFIKAGIKNMEFDDRGLLQIVELESNAKYFLYKNSEYAAEDVENPYEAIVLHNVVASYINSLLEAK